MSGQSSESGKTTKNTEKVLRYEQVVFHIQHLIQSGLLNPGDKLPSIRKICQQLGVGHMTAVHGYELLEAQGLIEAVAKSGFYVSAQPVLQGLPDFSVSEISTPSADPTFVSMDQLISNIAQVSGHPDFVEFGLAALSPDMLPVTTLKKLTASVARHSGLYHFSYDMPPGNLMLRQQIAQLCSAWGGFSANDVLITSGAVEALHICLRAVAKPGDTIAIESPAFYAFLQILDNLGMYAVEIPTNPNTGVDVDAYQQLVASGKVQACLIMANFSNPTGATMPENNKQRFVEVSTRYNIPIIEDDVYGDLYFSRTRPKPLKAYDTEGLVLYCSSFSKTICPGLRVGYTLAGQFQQNAQRIRYMTSIASPPLSEEVVARYLSQGLYFKWLKQLRLQLKENLALHMQAIKKYFPDSVKLARPEGGFLLWLQFDEAIDGIKLFEEAYKNQISIAPGQMFSPNKGFKNYIRLSFCNPWSPTIQQSLKTLGDLAKRQL